MNPRGVVPHRLSRLADDHQAFHLRNVNRETWQKTMIILYLDNALYLRTTRRSTFLPSPHSFSQISLYLFGR